MTELVNIPQEAIELIIRDNAYNIKIKCLGCSESQFIPYEPPIIQDEKLIIGEKSSRLLIGWKGCNTL